MRTVCDKWCVPPQRCAVAECHVVPYEIFSRSDILCGDPAVPLFSSNAARVTLVWKKQTILSIIVFIKTSNLICIYEIV